MTALAQDGSGSGTVPLVTTPAERVPPGVHEAAE